MPPTTRSNPVNFDALTLDTARGVTALCDAITYLRRADKRKRYPGMDDALKHLALAACKIPDEMFAIMFAANHIGMDEIAKRLKEVAA